VKVYLLGEKGDETAGGGSLECLQHSFSQLLGWGGM
jgi:hypothetical protein